MDQFPVSARRGKPHLTRRSGKQRVIASTSDIVAGVNSSASLPHDDAAGLYGLPAEYLDAQHIRIRISAVLGRTDAFLVCHD